MLTVPVFDFGAFEAAYNAERQARGLSWFEFADELTDQSADLNEVLGDHAVCGGAVSRLGARGATSCQYALLMMRWMGRAPEDFLTTGGARFGPVKLPEPGPGSRLRWNLPQLYLALDARRTERGLRWAELAALIGCTPSRLTNLRTARLADLELTMRVTQWLGRPSSDFIHAADW
ncbi:MAG: hypothetical protein ABIP33_01990 [Pseudolysinimonas sp.]